MSSKRRVMFLIVGAVAIAGSSFYIGFRWREPALHGHIRLTDGGEDVAYGVHAKDGASSALLVEHKSASGETKGWSTSGTMGAVNGWDYSGSFEPSQPDRDTGTLRVSVTPTDSIMGAIVSQELDEANSVTTSVLVLPASGGGEHDRWLYTDLDGDGSLDMRLRAPGGNVEVLLSDRWTSCKETKAPLHVRELTLKDDGGKVAFSNGAWALAGT